MSTVVAHALTTKEKVKEQLGISDSSFDSLIDSLINSCTDWIERYCGGRRFLRTTYSNKIMDSKGYDVLFLPNAPVASISAFEYRSGTWSTPTWNSMSANDYMLYSDAGYLQLVTAYPASPQFFRVSYIAGYLIDFGNELDTTKHTLPFDLTQAATELVAKAYQQRLSHGTIREAVEGQSVEWERGVSDSQKAVLLSHKLSYGF